MRINIKFFFLGMVIGIILFTIIIKFKDKGEVLSYSSIFVRATPTPTITPTPTSTPTPMPSPTPTITPSPTLTPTPTTTPTPLPPPASLQELEGFFNRFSGEYGVDVNLVKKIAYCESEYNSSAINGDYMGLFQFAKVSWITNRTEMGQDTNPDLRLNAEESIKTAAYLISKGKLFLWPNCN